MSDKKIVDGAPFTKATLNMPIEILHSFMKVFGMSNEHEIKTYEQSKEFINNLSKNLEGSKIEGINSSPKTSWER